MTQRTLGIWQIVLSGVCFGFLGLFGKTLYENGVIPGELLALRFLMASGLTFFVLAFTQRQLFRVSLRGLLASIVLGIFGYAVFSFCFFSALKGLSVSLSVLLLYTYPVLVTILAYVFFKEKVSRRKLLAFPFAGVGLIGLVWGDFNVESSKFILFGIAAAVFYAFYIIISAKFLRGVDARISTPLIQLSAGIVLASQFLRDFERTELILTQNWLLLTAIALVCSVAAMGLFQAGLQKLKSWEVSLLSTTEPLTGVLLAVVFLKESLNWNQLLSAVSLLLALIWVSLPDKR